MPPVIVLLGGENSRFWPLGGLRHKAFYEVGLDKPILYYFLRECVIAGVSRVIIVRRPADEGIEEFLRVHSFPFSVEAVVQESPGGMADAVLAAVPLLSADDTNFFLVDGNQVFFSRAARRFDILCRMRGAEGAIAVRKTESPERFGVATCDPSGFLANYAFIRKVLEKPGDLLPPQWRIVATYLLPVRFLEALHNHRQNKESGFETALDEYVATRRILAVSVDRLYEDISLKYPWDLFSLHEIMARKEFEETDFRKEEKLEIREGRVFVHKDAVVHPTVVLEGSVYVAEGAKIMEFAVVKNHSIVGKNALVGTQSVVRDFSFIGEGAIVGAHSEVTRSLIYKDARLHRNFFGDSILDRGAALGAGTITANRRHDRKTIRTYVKGVLLDSGKTSFGAILGDGARVGINCSLRPGVKIGRQARVYEGIIVKRDVEDGVVLKE